MNPFENFFANPTEKPNRQAMAKRGSWVSRLAAGMLYSLIGCTTCLAHTPLNPSKVMEFRISKSGLTRISIENDSIEDVYAYPADPDLITHHKSGHVFVTPDDLEIPVYLTLVTRRGTAQDLRLIPISKKAEPILLRFEETPPASPSLASLSPQDASAHLLAHFIKGKVPTNFFPISDTARDEVSRGEEPVEAVLDKVYHNHQFRVVVFNIKNDSPERRTLDNRVFWEKGDLASAFDRPTLGPQETARLFVVQQR